MTVAMETDPISVEARSPSMPRTKRSPLIERFLFLMILGLMLLAFGATDALPMNVSATAFFGLAAWLIASRPIEHSLRSLLAMALTIALLLAIWVVFQSRSSISIAYADSLAAVVPIMQPFAVFIIAFMLWPTDGTAKQLLLLLGMGGALFAAYGAVQLSLSPDRILFVRPTPYVDRLTATLLSPDGAAAVLGCVTVVLAVRSVDLIRRVLQREGNMPDVLGALLFSGSTLTTLAGLLLTQSRVEIGATAVGLGLAVGLTVAFPHSRRTSRKDRQQVLRRVGLGALAGAVASLSIGLLAARTLVDTTSSRSDIDTGCQLPSLFRMLGDNWLLGTGAGTFESAALPYANAFCGLSRSGVTDHSGLFKGWVSLGLPFVVGALVTIGVLALIFYRGMVRRRRMRWAPIAGMGVLTTAIISLAWTSSVYVPGVAAVIAAMLAPICAICLNDAHHNEGGSS